MKDKTQLEKWSFYINNNKNFDDEIKPKLIELNVIKEYLYKQEKEIQKEKHDFISANSDRIPEQYINIVTFELDKRLELIRYLYSNIQEEIKNLNNE